MEKSNCLSKENIRRLNKITEMLNKLTRKEEKYFTITKMIAIKSLCKNEYHKNKYIQYLSSLAIENIKNDINTPEKAFNLAQQAAIIIDDIDNKTINRKNINNLSREFYEFQDELRKIKWTTVRIVENNNLLIIEYLLKSLLTTTDVDLGYIYDATKIYTEKYNPRYGTGLIEESIPELTNIVDFWDKYRCQKFTMAAS